MSITESMLGDRRRFNRTSFEFSKRITESAMDDVLLRSITDDNNFGKSKPVDEDILSIKNQFSIGDKKAQSRSGRNGSQWGPRRKFAGQSITTASSLRPY